MFQFPDVEPCTGAAPFRAYKVVSVLVLFTDTQLAIIKPFPG